MRSDRNALRCAADALRGFGSLFVPRVEHEWVALETPFVGADYTPIELLVEWQPEASSYTVTDAGYIADYFYLYDHALEDDENLSERVARLAERLGAEVVGETIVASAPLGKLCDAARSVLQAALSVPEVWDQPERRVRRPSFRESVGREIERMSLPFSDDIRVRGAIETHAFDFGHRIHGNIVGVQTLSATRRTRALEKKKMLAWDISDVANAGTTPEFALVVDDSSPRRRDAVGGGVLAPLRVLFTEIIYWRELTGADFEPLREFAVRYGCET
ncbi:MAG: hypothetical protein U9R79_14755 [Armatimonadota bacterium]|nr:hypothetical protein [Armatimonadota bacterium]